MVGVELDYDSLVEVRTVDWVCHIRVIWMDGMSIVRRDHEALRQIYQIVLVGEAKRGVDSHQSIVQEGRCRSLFGATSDFFIVQYTVDGNVLFFLAF